LDIYQQNHSSMVLAGSKEYAGGGHGLKYR
jgi:hypothetical protein